MSATGLTVGLAERIIDVACLVLLKIVKLYLHESTITLIFAS